MILYEGEADEEMFLPDICMYIDHRLGRFVSQPVDGDPRIQDE